MTRILFNKGELSVTTQLLPCLIHGVHKAGSSLFTMTLLADLFNQGNKVLFICGYPMARDEFLSQTKNPQNKILVECESDLNSAYSKDVIMVKKENTDWFIRLAQNLPNDDNRITLIKNFELFDYKILDAIKNSREIIFSGDLDQCSFNYELLKFSFASYIYFSQPQINSIHMCPVLEKYQGYLWGRQLGGIVSIDN